MRRFEIDADTDRIVDVRAVVERQRGYGRIRVDRAKSRRQLLVVAQIHLDGRYADGFLGEKNADPARAWSGAAIVEFHPYVPLASRCLQNGRKRALRFAQKKG